ncbi:unnamed protein product (macronuclear) [Paramecium tetraurelia]|uniref:Uncharacterized protein n=1 Tax=Paramecium tetraurelia TaxID=5888 RepID=A0DMY2_PARTE|nr:uncharacterized protein GSPATT00018604001 [Paramecium tetraurelia]CAK84399.1 unnamed protein product [Paramecium tetraurelia]|eukprot:XP_001451796.1 hypothetical protein (macronuclear) [Paramecium tetraurelia strain d4-2]
MCIGLKPINSIYRQQISNNLISAVYTDYLTEEGRLKYELACKLDHIQELGTTVQYEVIYFMKYINKYWKQERVVHHPELFEAATKGYVIDTSNFVINTAHNIRQFEGYQNQ